MLAEQQRQLTSWYTSPQECARSHGYSDTREITCIKCFENKDKQGENCDGGDPSLSTEQCNASPSKPMNLERYRRE